MRSDFSLNNNIALLNKFEHRVFCALSLLLYKGVLIRLLNLHGDKKSLARTGER